MVMDAMMNTLITGRKTGTITLFMPLLALLVSIMAFPSAAASLSTESSAGEIKTGTVSGLFTVKGGSTMAGGEVMFYSGGTDPSPDITKYIRVPNLVVDINPNGGFTAEIPEGRFFFRAVKRNTVMREGKPHKGDYFFRFTEEGSSKPKEFSITAGQHIDFGTMEAKVWQDRVDALADGTAITGTLVDMQGRSLAKGVVFAFSSPDMQKGGKPLFVSDSTGKDGQFTLHVAAGGPYYLLARDILGGGRIAEGSLIGFYGTTKPVGITVAQGEIRDDITISVMRMSRRGPDLKPGEENRFDPGNIRSRKPPMLPAKNIDPQAE